jgi:hypothetical protein
MGTYEASCILSHINVLWFTGLDWVQESWRLLKGLFFKASMHHLLANLSKMARDLTGLNRLTYPIVLLWRINNPWLLEKRGLKFGIDRSIFIYSFDLNPQSDFPPSSSYYTHSSFVPFLRDCDTNPPWRSPKKSNSPTRRTRFGGRLSTSLPELLRYLNWHLKHILIFWCLLMYSRVCRIS